MVTDLRQGLSATEQRVLDKAEALRGSLRGASSPGVELEIEFGAVAAALEGANDLNGGPKVADLVRGAALFMVMAERLGGDCSDGAL